MWHILHMSCPRKQSHMLHHTYHGMAVATQEVYQDIDVVRDVHLGSCKLLWAAENSEWNTQNGRAVLSDWVVDGGMVHGVHIDDACKKGLQLSDGGDVRTETLVLSPDKDTKRESVCDCCSKALDASS